MQFVITAHDGEGMYEKRMSIRSQHLENMERIKEHVVCAGGLVDEDGLLAGSVLVLEYDSRDQLDEYLANEPYIREQVWADVQVEQMNVVILGGVIVGE